MIKQLKKAGQDYDFYPTTPEIIEILKHHIKEGSSVLDVGAGRGDVLKALEDKAGDLFAIEKSEILLGQLPASVFIVGTDFHTQTLIDKQVDIIFSNPPFSEFENWAVKLIDEAFAKELFLVLPERWAKSTIIDQAIKRREARSSILGEFLFTNAERKARGTVNLIKITLQNYSFGSSEPKPTVDPFNLWFNQTFPPPEKTCSDKKTTKETIKKARELAKGRNLIEVLEELYISDMTKLLDLYGSLQNIPDSLLEGLGITRSNILGSLSAKIKGLKNLYWSELFDNLNKLTDRLTDKSRGEMLATLKNRTYIDFSAENAYAVIIWAVKNANQYADSQISALYKDLSSPESCTAYQSNIRFSNSDWRYRFHNDEITHYKLDYRIVSEYFHSFSGYSFELGANGIQKNASIKINDICTVAKTMGFDVMERAESFDWSPGENKTFYYLDNGEPEEFAKIRLYKNGNAHIKFCKKFLLKLNVEAARILGWISNAGEASRELNESLDNVVAVWDTTEKIQLSNIKLLA